MEVPISQFRRDLFQLVEKSAQGEPLFITHRGRRFRVVPETPAPTGTDALTPLAIVNPNGPALDDPAWKDQMIREWESDWADL
ncbi:MAG TPA: type II toxin-antitoxin system prevent-host-death family antitoxin [Acidobacteriaceae bacterium]|jgi:prevent-host-death family protein|nr:type II toxin-antitoxin system prevent-host-death family antitoxin [Acidobacteriaceae bacterium]